MTTSPDLGRCPRSVAFVLAVGAVLGVVPDWSFLYFLWLLAGGFALLGLALLALMMLFRAFDRGDRQRIARRGWRLAASVAALPVLMMLGGLSQFVDVVQRGPALRAQAWAHDANGLPHLAVVQTGVDLRGAWGYVYDDSGQIEMPCGTQPATWLQAATDARLGDCDLHVSHVMGPYYRWEQR